MKNKTIHIEHDGEELNLKLENVSIPDVAVIIGDALNGICNNQQMLGNSTPDDAKNMIVNIILAKLDYDFSEDIEE